MDITDKTKKILGGLGLAFLTIGTIQTGTAVYRTSKEIENLDASNYLLMIKDGGHSFEYGFDDDYDGNLDRIERIQFVPSKAGMICAILKFNYHVGDEDFSWHNKRLLKLGHRRK